jgi:hypothetical protein
MTVALALANLGLIVAFGFTDMPMFEGVHPVVKMLGFTLILAIGFLVEYADELGDGNVGAGE